MTRVLLIDDDDALVDLLASYLRSVGHHVETASDGAEGSKMFRTAPCDVVVTDLVMPNREGLETINCLRRDYPGLPIIAISGAIDPPLYLELANQLGANRTFIKPFPPEDLADAISSLLPLRE